MSLLKVTSPHASGQSQVSTVMRDVLLATLPGIVVLTAYLFFKRNLVPFASGADLLALCTPIGLLLGRIANFINAELWGRATDMPWGVAFPGEAAQACGQISGLCARHPSQIYEALLEGVLLFLVLNFVIRKTNYIRGKSAALFLIFYSIFRSISEIYREPDIQIGYIYNFISMGSLLSIFMFACGIIMYIKIK